MEGWFQDVAKAICDMKMVLQKASKEKLRVGKTYEWEGRIGLIDAKTGKFISGIALEEAVRITDRIPSNAKEIKSVLRDEFHAFGIRRRETVPSHALSITRKRLVRKWTFNCSNGYAFRMSLSTEEETVLPPSRVAPDAYCKQRTTYPLRHWNYDFTTVERTNLPGVKRAELEIECRNISQHHSPWELAYRLADIVRQLSPNPPEVLRLEQNRTWPIETYIM